MPKPIRKKADKKIGLFMHKYVATLYYFDDDIQDIYWEMEEEAKKGNMDKVHELSVEMKNVIQLRSDKDSGYYSRRHDKMSNKISKKLSDKSEKIEKLRDQSPRKIYKMAKKVVGNKNIDKEEIEKSFDIENGEIQE